MVLRYSNGNIVLFESTGETGVTLTDWNDFLLNKWHLTYDKMVYRKLYCDRPVEMLNDLENFIKVNYSFFILVDEPRKEI